MLVLFFCSFSFYECIALIDTFHQFQFIHNITLYCKSIYADEETQ